MSKPDWKDAPEEAKFLAQDRDGDWYWWTGRPKVVEPLTYWMPSEDEQETAAVILPNIEVQEGWKETLESRP